MDLVYKQSGNKDSQGLSALALAFQSKNIYYLDFESWGFSRLFEAEKNIKCTKNATMLMHFCNCCP